MTKIPGAQIGVQINPILHTKKIGQVLAPKEKKLFIASNQCKFGRCDLWDAGYVWYATRHFHQRINEHKHSTIGRDQEYGP